MPNPLPYLLFEKQLMEQSATVLWRRDLRKEESTRYVNILIITIYRMDFNNVLKT